MRFLADGPDIPRELVATQERGQVIFVCGAGVSCTAGLSTFGGLVRQVYERLGEDWSLHVAEREGMQEDGELFGQYDRVLRCLERRLISSDARRSAAMRERIRDAVRQALALPIEVQLPNHVALLELSRDVEGHTRLITTNFETLFERAWLAQHNSLLPSHAGPAMPQPMSSACVGVLHLHGRLADLDARMASLQETSIILTSAEFGDAYLRSGWASRYIYDMARAYTLVLVGYEANDPPMRYLLEALEADRERFPDLRKVYAFASYANGEEDRQRALWKAKGIEPILYEVDAHDHTNLYSTIQEWKRYADDPTAWRKQTLQPLLAQRPASLAPNDLDRCVDLLGHADAGGILGDLSPSPEWLQLLNDKKIFTLDINEPGEWIATQVGNSNMIRACAGLSFLAPRTRDFISRAIDRERDALPALCIKAWELILSSKRIVHRTDYDELWYSIVSRVRRHDTQHSIRRIVTRILQPRLTVNRQIWLPDEEQREREATLSDLVRLDFEPEDHPTPDEILKLWPNTIDADGPLLGSLNRALIDSLEQARDVEFLGDFDRSSWDVPSVAQHEQNEYRSGFYPIVRTLADLWVRIAAHDPGAARQAARSWASAGFLLTSRLWLFALESRLFEAGEAVEAILKLDNYTFWRSGASVEIMRTLVSRWGEFEGSHRTSLEQRLRAGVPADVFDGGHFDQDEWLSVSDSSIFRRLKRLEKSGAVLDSESIDLLVAIQDRHPKWKPSEGDRDDFHSWHESRTGPDGNASLLVHIPDKDLVSEAMRLQRERGFDQGDLWRVFCAADPDRALRGLLHEADRGVWGAAAWTDMISAAANQSDVLLTAGVATALVQMPTGPARELLPYSTMWLMRQRKQTADPNFAGPSLIRVWDSLADLVFGTEHDLAESSEERDPIELYLGSAGGSLATILVDDISARRATTSSGLSQDHLEMCTRILSSTGAEGLMGRLLLAREMAFLDGTDARWTGENLVPRFTWTHPEALLMWRSYSQGRLGSATLFNTLKPNMLLAIERRDLRKNEYDGLISNLLSIALEHQAGKLSEYSLTLGELRRALTVGPKTVRRNASWILWHYMRADGDDRATRWRDIVGPLFQQAWPLDANLQSEETSKNLARMALECGSALPEAVEAVQDYLLPYRLHELSHSFGLERLLEEPDPQRILALVYLVDALIGRGDSLPADFTQFLDACATAAPPIREDDAFIRLYGLRRRENA